MFEYICAIRYVDVYIGVCINNPKCYQELNLNFETQYK